MFEKVLNTDFLLIFVSHKKAVKVEGCVFTSKLEVVMTEYESVILGIFLYDYCNSHKFVRCRARGRKGY